jgi:hypothetical protein
MGPPQCPSPLPILNDELIKSHGWTNRIDIQNLGIPICGNESEWITLTHDLR